MQNLLAPLILKKMYRKIWIVHYVCISQLYIYVGKFSNIYLFKVFFGQNLIKYLIFYLIISIRAYFKFEISFFLSRHDFL